jgi:hypothetical protein
MGMGVAKSMGIAGADAVVNTGKKWGRSVATSPWKATKFLSKTSGLTGGISQKYDNIKSKFDTARQMREARIAGSGPFAVGGALESVTKKQAEDYKKLDEAELRRRASTGDAAAAQRLAEDGRFDVASYSAYISSKGKDPRYSNVNKGIENKLRAKRADILIDHRISQESDSTKHEAIAQQELGKLTANQWKDQNWHSMLGFNDETLKYSMGSNDGIRRNAVRKAYKTMNKQQRKTVVEDMRGDYYAAGKNKGMPGGSIGW